MARGPSPLGRIRAPSFPPEFELCTNQYNDKGPEDKSEVFAWQFFLPSPDPLTVNECGVRRNVKFHLIFPGGWMGSPVGFWAAPPYIH